MKPVVILLVISITGKVLHAQTDYPDINKSLEKVVQQFPASLIEIKGNEFHKQGATTVYHSAVNISGAAQATITEQQFAGKKLHQWKTVLATGVNGELLKEKYREIFNRLNNSIIKSSEEKPFILSGKFRELFLSGKAASHFKLLPAVGEMKDIHVDLILEKKGKSYTLSLQVNMQ